MLVHHPHQVHSSGPREVPVLRHHSEWLWPFALERHRRSSVHDLSWV